MRTITEVIELYASYIDLDALKEFEGEDIFFLVSEIITTVPAFAL